MRTCLPSWSTAQKYTDQFAKLGPPFTSAVADPLPLTTKEIHAMLALGDRGRKPKTVALKMASLQPAQDAAKAAPEVISPLPSSVQHRRQGRVAKIPARRNFAAIARQTCRRSDVHRARFNHILKQQIECPNEGESNVDARFPCTVPSRRRKRRVSNEEGECFCLS